MRDINWTAPLSGRGVSDTSAGNQCHLEQLLTSSHSTRSYQNVICNSFCLEFWEQSRASCCIFLVTVVVYAKVGAIAPWPYAGAAHAPDVVSPLVTPPLPQGGVSNW